VAPTSNIWSVGRPPANDTIERFHRVLLEEWADIRHGLRTRKRTSADDGFIHFSNHHRAHGALGWSTPAATLDSFTDDVPGHHAE
jgi:transposase InsO family protein